MCQSSWKYVLRGKNRMTGDMNNCSFMTSDLLPNDSMLNCRVTNFILAEDAPNPYSCDIIEVRCNFNQPYSMDVKNPQSGSASGGISQSSTLCFIPNDTIPALLNPTENFVISRPTSQIWDIQLYNGETGLLLVDSNNAQPQNWVIVLEFTKINNH